MENPLYGGMFFMLLFISLVLYYITCLTDPGYVPISKYKRVGNTRFLKSDSSNISAESEYIFKAWGNRVDSRARECENPAYFVILAQNCDLGAPTIPQSTEKWCIFVSFVRIVVLFSTILVVNFRSFPLISVDPVVRDLTETSILLAETVNACAYVFLLSLS